jgi:HEPN domain-containing protein
MSDTPFEDREGSGCNAYLGVAAGDWDAYAEAFKLGAETLLRHVFESRMHLDLLIFPVVFLYRQYVELRLKELIEVTRHLDTEDRQTHDLARLWRKVRPELEQLFPGSIDHLDAAEQKISELAALDPRSFTFRYPQDRTGNATLPSPPNAVEVGADGFPIPWLPPPGPRQIDVPRFKERMKDLARLLDGCSTQIYEDQRAGWQPA